MTNKFIRYHGADLPIRITRSGDGIDKFLKSMNDQYPDVMSFISPDGIRRVTECASEQLVALKLPYHIHRGAVLLHVERGGNPDQLVRPAVLLQFRRKSDWILEKISHGNIFALQPILEGILLSRYQQSILLRAETANFPRPERF